MEISPVLALQITCPCHNVTEQGQQKIKLVFTDDHGMPPSTFLEARH